MLDVHAVTETKTTIVKTDYSFIGGETHAVIYGGRL